MGYGMLMRSSLLSVVAFTQEPEVGSFVTISKVAAQYY